MLFHECLFSLVECPEEGVSCTIKEEIYIYGFLFSYSKKAEYLDLKTIKSNKDLWT